jgi:hypothetical protein
MCGTDALTDGGGSEIFQPRNWLRRPRSVGLSAFAKDKSFSRLPGARIAKYAKGGGGGKAGKLKSVRSVNPLEILRIVRQATVADVPPYFGEVIETRFCRFVSIHRCPSETPELFISPNSSARSQRVGISF